MEASRPQLIFGTGIVGDVDVSTFADAESVSNLLGKLSSLEINRIDTAARYPSTRPTQSETLLGEAGVPGMGFLIGTMVIVKGRDVEGHLALDKVRESVTASLERLRTTEVYTIYNHAPDPVTPFEEHAKAFDEQRKKGACVQLGLRLSNLSTGVLRQWLELCEEKGYTNSKVYQGQYNILAREAEDEVFPLLRKNGHRVCGL